jgi:hypothetical protein
VDIETIRQELELYTGRFPAAAVRAAMEQREAMTPVLLATLQKVAEDSQEMVLEPNLMLPTRSHGTCAISLNALSVEGEKGPGSSSGIPWPCRGVQGPY